MTVSPIKPLETNRLILLPVDPGVLTALMTSGSDEEIQQFMGLSSPEAAVAERKKAHDGWKTWNRSIFYFNLQEKQTGQTLGWCGFHTWYLQHARAELGYGLFADEHKNKGYMKEALPKVIAYGFEQMHLHRIEAFASPANVPSIRLLQQNGFKEEGLLREHYFKNGAAEDSAVFSLLRREHRHQ